MLSSKSVNGDYLYLPERNPNFVSRHCLTQLNELMSSDLIPPRVLCGKPGCGVTSIGLQYAENAKDVGKYGLIRWMKMATTNQKIEWFKFAQVLNIECQSLSLQEVIRLIYRRLSSYRYLLIFDEVESYQFILSSLPSDAQAGQHILLLSTAAEILWPHDFGLIRVENFSAEETVAYVNRYCRLNRLEVLSSEESSLKLHDALSGYPLAITLALKYIHQQSHGVYGILTIEKFLHSFQARSLAEKFRHLSFGSLKLLFPLCDLIAEAIRATPGGGGGGATSQDLLEQLSVLSDCSAVPLALFQSVPSSSPSPASSPKASQTSVPFASTLPSPATAPASLNEESLLRPYFLYGLLQPLTPHSFGCHTFIQAALCELVLSLDTSGSDISRLTGYREETLFDKAMFPVVRKMYLQTLREEEKSSDEERQQCLQTAGDYHLQAKRLFVLLTFAECSGGVSSHSRSLLQKMRVMLSLILASTLWRLGFTLDSFNQYHEVHTLLLSSPSSLSREQLSDPTIPIPFEVYLHKRIGIVSLQLKKFSDALHSFHTFLQSIRQLGGGSSHLEDELQALLLLGSTSLALKRYGDAHGFFEQALISQRSLYRENHLKIAQSLHAIATVFTAQEVYSEALLLFRESLSIKKKVLPSLHSETIRTLLEIGRVYERQKKYSQALSQLEEVSLMVHKLYPDSHPLVALILESLAMVHKHENRLQDSLDSLQQAYQIRKRVYGEHHLEVALVMHKIAEIFKEQGRHTMALEWFQQTFNMKLMLFPEIHEEIAKTTFCIGSVYASQGRYVQALESFLNCLNTQRHLIASLQTSTPPPPPAGTGSAPTSPSSSTSAPPASCRGGESSEEVAERAREREEDLQIKNHEISETLRQIGNIYQNQGRYLQALTAYEESLQLQTQLRAHRQETHSSSHTSARAVISASAPASLAIASSAAVTSSSLSATAPHSTMIAQLMCQIGSVYKSQERYEEALKTYERALVLQTELYGPIHTEVAITLSHMASIHTSQGSYNESLLLLKQSLLVKKGVYPQGHQSIIVTEETIRRTENQRELKERILTKLQDYIENRLKEAKMVSSSYSLGMVFSQEEKTQAARFIVSYVERTGLERLGELTQSDEFQQYEGPLTNGRLGQLMKSILDEIYARENMLPTSGSNRSRGQTI
jgi:tetratricopeptide (TPR) repeat protein